MDDRELESLFSPVCQVISARVVTDRGTGRSRGFGFVEMDDAGGARALAESNGKDVGGRPFRANEANERRR